MKFNKALLEYYGVDPARVPDFEEFWALYATSFYERLFKRMDDPGRMQQIYMKYMGNPKLDKRDKAALTFFYNLRLDELEDPNYWDKVGKGSFEEINKNESKKPMKAKLVKESLNESNASQEDFNRFATELEKRRIPCKVVLKEFAGKQELEVHCGWDYPDSLFDKVYSAAEAVGVRPEIMAESSGGTIIASKRIAGGPKNYSRGRRW